MSETMPTYVMLTTVGPDGWARIREQPERIKEVTAEVEAMGLTVLAQYALLGQWDFLNVIESPDEATMARAAVALAARGTMRTTTLQAVSVDELIESLRG
ncbi:MAG TPA: GYD domain-containing protein [Acidimicrobiia bacterium]